MKIYLVGGAIRDKLLGYKNIRDKDWVVVGSSYNEMISLGFKPVGNSFPVFIHPKTKEEYALARKETKNGVGYKGFDVNCSSCISLKDDLFRRDITINAIAMDNNKKYYDPFGGLDDIKNRIIRHVSIYFLDDPIRLLRVARFYTRFFKFKFVISDKTFVLMKNISYSGELFNITPERIWMETEKVFGDKNIFIYFYILYKCHALKFIFPELYYFFKNNKFFYYFVFIFNKLYVNNFDINLNFVCLCFFFNCTIFSKEYFLNKKFIINVVKLFCKRLHISNKLFFFFKKIYYFLYKVYFYKKENIYLFIINLLDKLDIWRNDKMIFNLLNLTNILKHLPLKNKYLFIILNENIINIYIYLNKINVQNIIKLGYKGKDIKKKIFLIRLKKIKFLFKKFNIIKKFKIFH